MLFPFLQQNDYKGYLKYLLELTKTIYTLTKTEEKNIMLKQYFSAQTL